MKVIIALAFVAAASASAIDPLYLPSPILPSTSTNTKVDTVQVTDQVDLKQIEKFINPVLSLKVVPEVLKLENTAAPVPTNTETTSQSIKVVDAVKTADATQSIKLPSPAEPIVVLAETSKPLSDFTSVKSTLKVEETPVASAKPTTTLLDAAPLKSTVKVVDTPIASTETSAKLLVTAVESTVKIVETPIASAEPSPTLLNSTPLESTVKVVETTIASAEPSPTLLDSTPLESTVKVVETSIASAEPSPILLDSTPLESTVKVVETPITSAFKFPSATLLDVTEVESTVKVVETPTVSADTNSIKIATPETELGTIKVVEASGDGGYSGDVITIIDEVKSKVTSTKFAYDAEQTEKRPETTSENNMIHMMIPNPHNLIDISPAIVSFQEMHGDIPIVSPFSFNSMLPLDGIERVKIVDSPVNELDAKMDPVVIVGALDQQDWVAPEADYQNNQNLEAIKATEGIHWGSIPIEYLRRPMLYRQVPLYYRDDFAGVPTYNTPQRYADPTWR